MRILFHSKPWPGTQINRNHPLARGLVQCVVMNEGSGQPIELINDARPTHASVQWANGPNGPYLNFRSASSNILRYAYNPGNALPTSFAFWFKTTSASTSIFPVAFANTAENNSLVYFGINASPFSDSLAFLYRNAGATLWKMHEYTGTYDYSNGNWYHVVGIVDVNLMKLYINGVSTAVLTGSLPISGAITLNGLCIGGLVRTSTTFSDVEVDTVMVWNRVLSHEEVQSLCDNTWQVFSPRWVPVGATPAEPSIILKTSDLLFDAISDFNISKGIISLLSTTLDSSQDTGIPGYLYRTGEFGIDIITEFDNQFNVYKILNTSFDVINEFNIDYIRARSLDTTFDIITDFYLNPAVLTSSTTHVLSENFDAVIDYYIDPILRRSLFAEIDAINEMFPNGVVLTPTRTQFDLVADFDVDAIRAIGREFIVNTSNDFDLNFVISINLATQLNIDVVGDYYLDMYVKTALQTQFESTADVYIDAVRSIFATTDFDINGEYNVEYIIGKIIELYIDSVTDFYTIFSSRTAMDASFDSITDCDVIITNAVTSFIFTVEFDLIDNEVVTFCL